MDGLERRLQRGVTYRNLSLSWYSQSRYTNSSCAALFCKPYGRDGDILIFGGGRGLQPGSLLRENIDDMECVYEFADATAHQEAMQVC